MGIALDITHIGEALVAKLLQDQEIQKVFWGIYRAKFKDQDVFKIIEIIPNADIENGDPKHQIDILLLGEKEAIAIEAKLGTSLRIPSSFYKAHLTKEFDFDNKKGSMIQFFTKRINDIKLKDRNHQLANGWVLLVRKNKIKECLSKNNFKDNKKVEWENMLDSCVIISIEELFAGISPDDFNDAVRRCIKSNNYSAEWGINLSAPSGVSGLSQEN